MSKNPSSMRNCKPCEKSTKPLSHNFARTLLNNIKGWKLSDGKLIRKTLKCRNFLDAIGLIQKIAAVAEAQNHHPDLHLTNYRKLAIELYTHSVGGLSENDFILAAKIDELLAKR